jgi:hypothetical protein
MRRGRLGLVPGGGVRTRRARTAPSRSLTPHRSCGTASRMGGSAPPTCGSAHANGDSVLRFHECAPWIFECPSSHCDTALLNCETALPLPRSASRTATPPSRKSTARSRSATQPPGSRDAPSPVATRPSLSCYAPIRSATQPPRIATPPPPVATRPPRIGTRGTGGLYRNPGGRVARARGLCGNSVRRSERAGPRKASAVRRRRGGVGPPPWDLRTPSLEIRVAGIANRRTSSGRTDPPNPQRT